MDLFVPVTGKFRLFGGVGIIIAITLLFKWKCSRHVLGIIITIYLIVTIFIAFQNGNRLIFDLDSFNCVNFHPDFIIINMYIKN